MVLARQVVLRRKTLQRAVKKSRPGQPFCHRVPALGAAWRASASFAHSVEVFDGRPYVVLELISGGRLNRWIGSPRLNESASHPALSFAWVWSTPRQGLHCHRDIKPANLMVTEDERSRSPTSGSARISEEMVGVFARNFPTARFLFLEQLPEFQPIICTDPRDRDPDQNSTGQRCAQSRREARQYRRGCRFCLFRSQ